MAIILRNIIAFLLLFCSFRGQGQDMDNIDSLKKLLQTQPEDTGKVKLLYTLSFSYVAGSYADTALDYAQRALKLAEKLNDEAGMFWSEIPLCESLAILGNHPLALDYSFRAFERAKKLGDNLKLCYANGNLAACYYYMGDFSASLQYAREVTKIIDSSDIYWMWIQMSKAFYSMRQHDSALLYAVKANEMIRSSGSLYAKSVISPVLGNAYAGKHEYDSAALYYQMGIPLSIKRGTGTHLIDNYYGLAEIFKSKNELDSALAYAKKTLTEKITAVYPMGMLKAAALVADIYQFKNNSDSALKYLRIAISIKDSLSNRQKTIAVQNLIYKEQEKQKEIASARQKLKNELLIYGLIAGLVIAFIVTILLVRAHRQKQIQNIRNGIADDLHDDIGSTLSSISIMSELAKKRSPEASAILSSIGESTIAIQENMSDIVWAIKSENDFFENLLQRMKQFASEILGAKNISLNFETGISVPVSKLTMKQRKNLYLFFKEVINNTAKHADAKQVFVNIFKKEQRVVMTIRDDGKGFDAGQTFNGNGMSTLKKRAEELNGDFSIQSQPGEGTVVELRFKIT
jgi:two-component system sensor histidine kinase UhpB